MKKIKIQHISKIFTLEKIKIYEDILFKLCCLNDVILHIFPNVLLTNHYFAENLPINGFELYVLQQDISTPRKK